MRLREKKEADSTDNGGYLPAWYDYVIDILSKHQIDRHS